MAKKDGTGKAYESLCDMMSLTGDAVFRVLGGVKEVDQGGNLVARTGSRSVLSKT